MTAKPLMATMVVRRRPMTSPKWPKMMLPIGRPIRVTANTNRFKVATV